MKKNLFYLVVLICPIIFNGCLRTYYPVGMDSGALPMVFDHSDSTNQKSKFYNVDLSTTKSNHENESLQMLRGGYTVVDTREHFNVNTTLYGYTGIYHVAGLPKYDGPKSVFGFGGEFRFNVNFKIHSFKIGLGFATGGAGEFGGYYFFRKKAANEGIIKSDQGLFYFTFSVFPVLAYELSESSVLSAQINVGTPGFVSPNIVLNTGDYVYWISWIPNRNRDAFTNRFVFGFMININTF